jgi:uncharacterized protein (DUF1501 family)
MKKISQDIARRNFLRESCGAMSGISLLSTLLNLRMIGSASAVGVDAPGADDYRAMVCLFLPGGIDSYNILVPRGASEYAQYASTRSNLALSQGSLVPLNNLSDQGGRTFGVHPGYDDVAGLFNDGNLAFVSNVGTLIEPIADAADQGNHPRPKGLYSHADQIKHWQTSVPQDRSSIGWGGRCADVLNALNDPSVVSMNISLNGTNTWQAGNAVFEYAVDSSGAINRNGYTGNSGDSSRRGAGVDSLLEQEYLNIFEQTFAAKHRETLEAAELFNSATDSISFSTPTPTHSNPITAGALPGLANRMRMIAKSIAAHQALGTKRQTFFISSGGWDHHNGVIDPQAWMVPVIGRSIKYFWDLLGEIGMRDKVTLFTASDFARTLNSNGRGSDHAWGGNHLVMGGAVTGQRIYGTFPDLAPGASHDAGRGRQVPTTSCDEFFAEMAQWMGVSHSDLDYVLPNIRNFYTPSSTQAPLGFLV